MRHTYFFLCMTAAAALGAMALLASCDDKNADGLPVMELISPERMEIPSEGGTFEILYEITNPSDQGVHARTEDGDEWISDINPDSYGKVTFHASPNDSGHERSADIIISYENNEYTVEVSQSYSEATLYDVEFEASMITGFYYGEKYSPGMGDYWFFFTDIGFDQNYAALPSGTYYRIDLYAPLADKSGDVPIPEGSYRLDVSEVPSCEAYTFSQAMSMFYTTDESGHMNESEARSYTDGTLDVVKTDNGYRLDMVVTTSDGLVHHVFYEGEVALINETGGGSADPDLPDTAGEFPAIEQDVDAVFDRCASVLLGSYSGISEVNVQFANMGTDENGDWIGPGTALDVHFYTRLNSKYEIEEGTYTCGRGNAGLFRPGGALDIGIWAVFGTYVTSLDGDDNKTVGLVESGEIDVIRNGDTFTVTFNLGMQGGHQFTGSYSGPIRIDGSTAGILSTLTGDYEVDFTQGEIKATANYWGDFYNTGTGNWTIDISPAPGSTQDDTFITDICCANTGFDDDISGTYTASTNNEAGTFMPGYVSGTNIMGTMYLGGFDTNGYVTKLAPAMEGKVTISKNGDGTYTISFDCMDDAVTPHNFHGTWTGPLNLVNQSTAAASAINHTVKYVAPRRTDNYNIPTKYSYIQRQDNSAYMYR